MNLTQNKKYLEAHNVTKFIEELMAGLIKEKPNEPLLFMMNFIKRKAIQNGISIPLHSKFEMTNDVHNAYEGERRSEACERDNLNSRSYDKPWLNGSVKKADQMSHLHQEIVKDCPSSNIVLADSSTDISSNVNQEFALVSLGDEVQTTTFANIEDYRAAKMIKPESKTKANLSRMIEEEEENKVAQKLKLEEKLQDQNNLCEEYDCAVVLSEDPDICQNEFNVFNPVPIKSGSAVVVIKQVHDHNHDVSGGISLTMCPNCAKLYQVGDNYDMTEHCSSTINRKCYNDQLNENPTNSVLLDDLESASQVNGPRPIGDFSLRQHRPVSAKKKISVTDIEESAKGWPVLDSGSESSMNRRNITATKPSSRQFNL